MRIVVVGAGVAGLAASLALAEDGHDVTLLDRDGEPDRGPWNDTLDQSRPGCPQLNQVHSLLARGTGILEQRAPDAYQALLDLGGRVTDPNMLLPPEHHDPALRSVAIRRPLIDRALMGVARERPTVTIRPGLVRAFSTTSSGEVPVVTGVVLDDGEQLAADLVVDAAGRGSKLRALLADAGVDLPPEETSECGIVYFSRYYRLAEGVAGPPPYSPVITRAQTSWGSYTVSWQEEGAYAVVVHAPTSDRALRALRDGAAFDAAMATVPQAARFVDPSFGRAVSPVVPYGGLRNSVRPLAANGRVPVRGYVGIGDTRAHTDPVYAFGMSMAIFHAFLLADLLRADADGAVLAFEESIREETGDRFRLATESAREHAEQWAGRPVDLDRDVHYLADFGLPNLLGSDHDGIRRFFRRALGVDLPREVEQDEALLARTRDAVVANGALRSFSEPSREQLLAAMAAAV